MGALMLSVSSQGQDPVSWQADLLDLQTLLPEGQIVVVLPSNAVSLALDPWPVEWSAS